MGRKMIYAEGAPKKTDTPKVRFAKRLNAMLQERGWSQAEFTLRVKNIAPAGEDFGKHLTSNYCVGKSLPELKRLQWMAKALKVKPEVLLPPEDAEYVGKASPMRMEMLEGGMVRLKLDVELESEAAMKIMRIVNAAE